ncbi:MAG: TRAP transporter small permease [Ectothiorhodospiraceae bacterium]|jgi:TRAP-type C4-dicarboxylate transport system permease small subunit
MFRLIDAISLQLARLSMGVAAIAATVMVTSLLLGVFYRYVLQASLSWTGEVALFAFTWVVFLVSSLGVREGFHVRVTVVDGLLPEPALRVLHRLILLAIGVFGLVLLWTGYDFAVFTSSQVSAAIRYPVWMRNAAVPVGGALIAVHALARLLGSGHLDPTAEGSGA